jgi:hypothetical protein
LRWIVRPSDCTSDAKRPTVIPTAIEMPPLSTSSMTVEVERLGLCPGTSPRELLSFPNNQPGATYGMPSITLANAFKQPFGPWREDLVLSQKWQTKKGEILTLDNVLLTQGTAAVGLVDVVAQIQCLSTEISLASDSTRALSSHLMMVPMNPHRHLQTQEGPLE